MRLFRELRPKLSAGFLFSQSGHPIESHPPFINDDDTGYQHPFAKPYIIGYALLGLPRLAKLEENEPQFLPVVQAVADFNATSQDPAGGCATRTRASSYLLTRPSNTPGRLSWPTACSARGVSTSTPSNGSCRALPRLEADRQDPLRRDRLGGLDRQGQD